MSISYEQRMQKAEAGDQYGTTFEVALFNPMEAIRIDRSLAGGPVQLNGIWYQPARADYAKFLDEEWAARG